MFNKKTKQKFISPLYHSSYFYIKRVAAPNQRQLCKYGLMVRWEREGIRIRACAQPSELS